MASLNLTEPVRQRRASSRTAGNNTTPHADVVSNGKESQASRRTSGLHKSHLLNALDPRVHSDAATDKASNTAGGDSDAKRSSKD